VGRTRERPGGMSMSNSNSLITLPSNLNLNVRRPFFELTLKVNRLQIGIALGLSGLIVAIKHLDQRWFIAIGKWGVRR
jgi:hypothetical protein